MLVSASVEGHKATMRLLVVGGVAVDTMIPLGNLYYYVVVLEWLKEGC